MDFLTWCLRSRHRRLWRLGGWISRHWNPLTLRTVRHRLIRLLALGDGVMINVTFFEPTEFHIGSGLVHNCPNAICRDLGGNR